MLRILMACFGFLGLVTLVRADACQRPTAGLPLLEVLLTDAASGQEVRVRHTYPNGSPASHYAASNLARSLRGQVAELDATNPRFRARRLECDAAHIGLPYQTPSTRKDLE